MKVDTHVHSKYSPDSFSEIGDILKAAKSRGLEGIAVTDHNTIQGGLAAQKQARGIEVIVGAEVRTDQGEVIGYHLNQEIKSKNFTEVLEEMKSQGALIAIPHPFDFIRSSALRNEDLILQHRKKIDYLEVNGRSLPWINHKAVAFASEHKFPLLGGSDAHYPSEIGSIYTIWNNDQTEVVGKTSLLSLLPVFRTAMRKRIKKLFKSVK